MFSLRKALVFRINRGVYLIPQPRNSHRHDRHPAAWNEPFNIDVLRRRDKVELLVKLHRADHTDDYLLALQEPRELINIAFGASEQNVDPTLLEVNVGLLFS